MMKNKSVKTKKEKIQQSETEQNCSFSENSFQERKQSEREQSERKQSERQQSERKQSERQQSERKQSEREQSERKQLEREQSERQQSERQQSEREQSERQQSEREQSEREQSEREQLERQQLEREQSERELSECALSETECHPWEPFYPEGTLLLMFGSFPPPKKRWSMPFYYPNWQNDMWRIFGQIFFQDSGRFELLEKKAFNESEIKAFLTEKRIGMSDVVKQAVRQRGNASDRFLDVVETIDLEKELRQLPDCRFLATAGQKSTDVLGTLLNEFLSVKIGVPAVGCSVLFYWKNREYQWFRMPSSSRAYPKPLAEKSLVYKNMFRIIYQAFPHLQI